MSDGSTKPIEGGSNKFFKFATNTKHAVEEYDPCEGDHNVLLANIDCEDNKFHMRDSDGSLFKHIKITVVEDGGLNDGKEFNVFDAVIDNEGIGSVAGAILYTLNKSIRSYKFPDLPTWATAILLSCKGQEYTVHVKKYQGKNKVYNNYFIEPRQ